MDANFRLKLRDRHIKNDPELGPGWAYYVDEKVYQEEMKKYGDQIEVYVICFVNYMLLTVIIDQQLPIEPPHGRPRKHTILKELHCQWGRQRSLCSSYICWKD